MVDKSAILSLNFKSKAGAPLGDYAVSGKITDVTLLNWRGQPLNVGSPGLAGVGSFGAGTLAALYNTTANNTYSAGILSSGGLIKIGAEKSFTINGLITCDTKGPKVDGEYSYIGIEAAVDLYNSADVKIASVKSDYDGKYAIANVPAGTYYISASKSKYGEKQGAAFTVGAAGDISNQANLSLQLARKNYTVSGTVYGTANSNGSGATPLAGVNVYVLSIGYAYKVLGGPALTDGQGHYTVETTTDSLNKPFSTVGVEVTGALEQQYGSQLTLVQRPASGSLVYGERVPLRLNLGMMYGIHFDNDYVYPQNTATYGMNGSYNFMLNGDINNRNIILTSTQEIQLRTGTKSNTVQYQLKDAQSDAAVAGPVQSLGTNSGDDRLQNVPKGSYYIEVSRPGYISGCTLPFTVDTTRIVLRNAPTSNTLDLQAVGSGNTLAGTVLDDVTGLPLEDVRIVCLPYSASYGRGVPIFSATDGAFSYLTVNSAKDLVFSKAGYVTQTVYRAAGNASGLTIRLIPDGSPQPLPELVEEIAEAGITDGGFDLDYIVGIDENSDALEIDDGIK
jgi:hypothetical protein